MNTPQMIPLFFAIAALLLNAPVANAICGPGTYAPTPATCMPCAAGTYAPVVALTACFSCGQGTYTSITRSSTCLQCAAGSVQPLTGATTCVACASGFAQPNPGRTDCLPVSPAEPCGFGSILIDYACVACPYGTYTNTTGATTCLECPADANVLGPLIGTQCAGLYARSPDVCARRFAVPFNTTGIFGALETVQSDVSPSLPEWPAWALTLTLLGSAIVAMWYAVWMERAHLASTS